MKEFFEHIEILDKLKKTERPSQTVLENVIEIIKNDAELTRYFYDKNKQGALNAGWLELLNSNGEFAELEAKEAGIVARIKALYLVDCASIKPEIVLEIIKRINTQDMTIQGILIDALLKMPVDITVKELLVVLRYLGGRDNKVWYFIGEAAAKLMVNLAESYPKEAFEIARLLLDLWRPEEKEAGGFETIRGKFATHEYKDLMFEYYKKVWEKRPFEAMHLLVDIYDKYLEECIKEKKYDVSEYLGVSLQDLEDIQRLNRDLEAIVVKAICDGGQLVIEKEPQSVSELLEDLEKRNKGVFHRVEMHLLRFVPAGTEKERINKLIGDQKFIENGLYQYEHRKLLNDKFDEIEKDVKEAFITWVDKQKKEVEEWCQKNNAKRPDFVKWENQEKAEELYLVREKFKELYEEYKKKSGLNDADLAPRRMVGEARSVSPEEGSSYSSEKMGQDSVENVVNYLLDTKNYEGKEKVSGWGTAKFATAASFGTDVKKRPMEYLNIDLKKLESLDPEFLDRLFSCISETVRNGSFKKEGWERLIDLAGGIVETKNKEKEWKNCFLAILWVLNDGFGEESNRITFNETIIRKFWSILKEQVGYSYDEKSESEDDPIQRQLRSVQGGAFGLVVSLAIECKKNFSPVFNDFLKKEMVQIYTLVANEIKRSEVNCTFGYRFASIYWLDEKWVESNTEIIFDDAMWDTVWGTYVSWGRPSPACFKFLVEKGIYSRAVERIGTKNKYKFSKRPDEGLVEHLMIGYFNGWVNLESDVLKQFFKKASAELRGEAARFLTTGFKSVKEEGKLYDEIAVRMRAYWKGRLAAIKNEPKENEKEAIGLTGWVEDSVLPAKETLELLEQSLELSGGKIGEMRDARNFIEGINKLGKGNELLALQCLKKAAEDKNMHFPWARIEEPLVSFLETIVDLSEEVRNVGKEVADLYGRYNPDKFRGVWEKLNVKRE